MSSPAAVHAPLGGDVVTRPIRLALFLVGLGALCALWRFSAGLAAVSNLTDGYPWGIWIAFDVVTGTAFGCGGYAVALLVYVLNKGQYHPLVRPALLTSVLGYGLAVLAVTIDLGRPWELWKVPVFFWRWSGSPQLEVALCVATYVLVLLVELSPAALEQWQKGPEGALRRLSAKLLPVLQKSLLWIIALGMLLPTMHQSSLGTMMMLAGPRLHPLWFTSWLPLLFLVNALLMGYAAVVLESAISARAFDRPYERMMLASLSQVALPVTVAWLVLRVATALLSGRLDTLASGLGLVFLAEVGLHVVAIAMLASPARRATAQGQVSAALVLALAGMGYRLNTYLVAFQPGGHWTYFPAVPEFLITLGIVALEVVIYVYAVRRFPILQGTQPARS
jgi:Ni/Fe-hydrogenase subunit HybB-like protein